MTKTCQLSLVEAQGKLDEAQDVSKKRLSELHTLQEELRSTNQQLSKLDVTVKECDLKLTQAESVAQRQIEGHQREVLNVTRSLEETRSLQKLAEDKLRDITDAQAYASRSRKDSATQTNSAVPVSNTENASRASGSASASQARSQLDHARQGGPQLDPRQDHTQIRKHKRKVDRDQSSQAADYVQSISSKTRTVRVEVPRSDHGIPDTQLNEDMLDNRRPNTQDSAAGFNVNALDDQLLDHNGVRMVSQQSSSHGLGGTPLRQNGYMTRFPSILEETLRQGVNTPKFPSVVEEPQSQELLQFESSPLSSPQPNHLQYQQISAEETNANLASQGRASQERSSNYNLRGPRLQSQVLGSQAETQDDVLHTPSGPSTSNQNMNMSPSMRRDGVMSRGKKRDPPQFTQAVQSPALKKLNTRSTGQLPTGSQRQRREGNSFVDEIEDYNTDENIEPDDPYELRQTPVGTPVRSKTQKRSASHQDASSEHGSSKRPRVGFGTLATPRTQSSRATPSSSQAKKTGNSQSSLVNNTSAMTLASSGRNSSGVRGSGNKTKRSAKKSKSLVKQDHNAQY